MANPESTAAHAVETPYADSLQHLRLMHGKVQRLNDLRRQAEDQLIHRTAMDYRAGRIGGAEVHAVYQACRAIFVRSSEWSPEELEKRPGFRDRWNAAMPEELKAGRLQYWAQVRYAPDPDGNWRGHYPFEDSTHAPVRGLSVVYVLFDAENIPCYVGSTNHFRARVRAHAHDGKRFVRWLAYPCRDRDHAYELEDRLLKEHKPYLNIKASR